MSYTKSCGGFDNKSHLKIYGTFAYLLMAKLNKKTCFRVTQSLQVQGCPFDHILNWPEGPVPSKSYFDKSDT